MSLVVNPYVKEGSDRRYYRDPNRQYVTVMNWTDRHGVEWRRVFDSDEAALNCKDALRYQRTLVNCPVSTLDDN